ncbi:MAG: radical SAM protein [Myxococcales bacterium]|nr:radical SAM protein [Myxococcales bacterium]
MGDLVDIRFAFPPYGFEGFAHSIAAYYLAEYLGGAGLRATQYINASPLGPLDAIAEEIAAEDARAYGLIVYDSNALLSLALARRLRRLRPGRLIVAGGPFCEPAYNLPTLLGDGAPFDVVVTGSGYQPLAELLTQARAGAPDPASILGVAARDAKGQLRANPKAPRPPLAELPSPYLSGRIDLAELYEAEGHFALIRAQGCTAHCLFCNFAVRSGFRVDAVPIERTLAELERFAAHARERGALCHVMLSDDDFAIDRAGAKEFCARVIDAGLQDYLCFYSHMSVNHADRELIELMARANFAEVNFGVESGVPRVLHQMRKLHAATRGALDLNAERAYLEEARELVAYAREVGLDTTASFVTGMPFETREDALQTLEYIKTLDLGAYSVNHFTPLSGSVFTRQRKGEVDYDPRYATLPRRALYRFDPTEIPRLPHAFVYPSVKIPIHFTGEFSTSAHLPSGMVYPSLVLVAAGWGARAPEAIAPIIHIGDHLFVEVEHEDAIEAIDHACVAAEVPVTQVAYVHPVLDSGAARELFVHPRYEVTSIVRAGFAALDGLALDFDGRPRRAADTALLATIEGGEDLERFIAALLEIEAFERPPALAELLGGRHPLRVIHGCRWSLWGCQARALGLIVANTDGSLSPCVGGPRIPGPHRDRVHLQVLMEARVAEDRAALGCEGCSARDNCPGCVSLAGIERGRYCELVRGRGWLTHVLPILRILEESAARERLPAVRVGIAATQRFELDAAIPATRGADDRGLYVAREGDEYLVVDVREKTAYGVDRITALLVEAARAGLGAAAMIELLGEAHGIDEEAAAGRIERFLARLWRRPLATAPAA